MKGGDWGIMIWTTFPSMLWQEEGVVPWDSHQSCKAVWVLTAAGCCRFSHQSLCNESISNLSEVQHTPERRQTDSGLTMPARQPHPSPTQRTCPVCSHWDRNNFNICIFCVDNILWKIVRCKRSLLPIWKWKIFSYWWWLKLWKFKFGNFGSLG